MYKFKSAVLYRNPEGEVTMYTNPHSDSHTSIWGKHNLHEKIWKEHCKWDMGFPCPKDIQETADRLVYDGQVISSIELLSDHVELDPLLNRSSSVSRYYFGEPIPKEQCSMDWDIAWVEKNLPILERYRRIVGRKHDQRLREEEAKKKKQRIEKVQLARYMILRYAKDREKALRQKVDPKILQQKAVERIVETKPTKGEKICKTICSALQQSKPLRDWFIIEVQVMLQRYLITSIPDSNVAIAIRELLQHGYTTIPIHGQSRRIAYHHHLTLNDVFQNHWQPATLRPATRIAQRCSMLAKQLPSRFPYHD